MCLPSFRLALASLLTAVAMMLGGSLQAQTITNIAEARWNSGGQDFSIRSNEVSFDIAPNAAIIETFRLAPGGPTTVNFTPSLCGNPRAALAIGGTGNAPITVNTSRDFSTGDMLVFEIIAAAANLDPNAVDRLEAVLTNTSGDRESLEIFETGANTGSFFG
ncbi:MAG: hypothetical protein WBH10_04265, partial [Allopontixanthobacter sediminis]